MDHLVLLLGSHPVLRHHLIEALCEGSIHGPRVGPIFHRRIPETKGGGQGAGFVGGAVTVDADGIIQDTTTVEKFPIARLEGGDQGGVVYDMGFLSA